MTDIDACAVRARGVALISEARELGDAGDIFGGVDHVAMSRAGAKFSTYFVDAANAIAAAKMEPEACTEAELQGVVALELLMKRVGKHVRDALVRPDGVCAVDIIGGRPSKKKTANSTHTVVPKRARGESSGGGTAAVQIYTGDGASTCLWDDEGAKIRRIIKVVAAFIEDDVDKVAFQPVVPGSHAVTVGAVVVNIEGDVLYNKAITMVRTKTGPYFLNDMVASWVEAQELTHEAVFLVPECPDAKRVIVMMPHQLYTDGPLAHPDYPDVRLVPVFSCTNVAGNKKGMSVKLGTSRLRQLFSEEEAPAIINEVYELDCRQINNKKQKPSSDTA